MTWVLGEPISTLSDELGTDAADTLRRWCTENRTDLYYAGWRDIGNGNTAASVFAVHVFLDGILRKLVLKVIPRSWQESREPRRHADMLAASPKKFRRRHLVEQVWDPIPLPNGGWIMFQEVAGGDLEEFRSLSHLLREHGPQVAAVSCCREVVSSVLTDWNPKEREPSYTTPGKYLRGLLGGRLDQKDQEAPLARWLRNRGLLADSRPTGTRLGEKGLWPNPLTLVLDDEITRGRKLLARTGNAHGDLHPGNILLPADPSMFRLIDLSRAGKDRPLAFDPVHLLLTTTAYFLPDLSSRQLNSLAYLLLEPAHGRDSWVPGPLCDLVTAITKSGDDRARSRSLITEWREETMLCLVGCALIMAGRNIHEGNYREWFLELAARGAAAYLKEPTANVSLVLQSGFHRRLLITSHE